MARLDVEVRVIEPAADVAGVHDPPLLKRGQEMGATALSRVEAVLAVVERECPSVRSPDSECY